MSGAESVTMRSPSVYPLSLFLSKTSISYIYIANLESVWYNKPVMFYSNLGCDRDGDQLQETLETID